MSWQIARLEEIAEISDGRVPQRPVRHHFGITSFGVNSFTGKETGDRIINEHDEADDRHEELYVVLGGRATFELDGERVDAPAGTLVFAEAGVKRTAFAEQPGTTILALGGEPGKAYEPEGWEIWMPLHPLYAEGKYEEAIERGRATIEANPQYAGPFYNLACCEALAGRKTDAIEHLRHALGSSDRYHELARTDTDLDALRDEPAFKELYSRGSSTPR